MTKFFRAIKTAFLYMFRNFGLSFASIVVMTLSFFIVSVVGLAFYGSLQLVEYIDSKPPLVVFLRGDLSEAQAQEFSQIINNTGLAKEFSIKDIEFSKNEFYQSYNDPELKANITDEEAKAYFPVITYVYSDSQQNLQKIIDILGNDQNFMNNIVDKANSDKIGWYSFNTGQAEVIRSTSELIRTVGIAISVFLFIISSVLIFITIKLTINYHRHELEIMNLVGADGWFIRLPFVVDGIIYGMLGGIISTAFIFLFQKVIFDNSQGLSTKISDFFSEVPWPEIDAVLILELFVITALVGAIVGALSSSLAIMTYVKRK